MNVFSIANLKSYWTIIKVVKTALAIAVLVQAYIAHEFMLGVFGMFFLGQTIFNIGCGSPAGCGLPASNKVEKSIEDITFTEVNSNK